MELLLSLKSLNDTKIEQEIIHMINENVSHAIAIHSQSSNNK